MRCAPQGRIKTQRRLLLSAPLALLLIALGVTVHLTAGRSSVEPPLPVPAGDAVFTSTRYISSLAVTPDGEVWAGTLGGVLRRDGQGHWRKFTTLDGLPSHEVREVSLEGDTIRVTCPRAAAVWQDGKWRVEPAPAATRPIDQLCAATWQGKRYAATVAGLQVEEGKGWKTIPLPATTGTHISALLPHGDQLWVALFGEGLRAFDGADWRPAPLTVPDAAREITALADGGDTLWLGTRRAGVWSCANGIWSSHLPPDDPYDHNCQALALFQGHLFVSTLEDGLVVGTGAGWQHYLPPLVSSAAPRQLVAFKGALYVRHGNHRVDRFDGQRWELHIGKDLPRKEVSALAADAEHLSLAQWGGWSDFDGRAWTHHLKHPELQGTPVTALYADGHTLWIGTQNRGLFAFDRKTGTLRAHDDRHALPDDWIKVITRVDDRLYVGTFVGGLASWDGTRWTTEPQLLGEEITALAPDAAGGLYLATRTALWHRAPIGTLIALPAPPEIQALCPTPTGLWLGTRTGLYYQKVTKDQLQR